VQNLHYDLPHSFRGQLKYSGSGLQETNTEHTHSRAHTHIKLQTTQNINIYITSSPALLIT